MSDACKDVKRFHVGAVSCYPTETGAWVQFSDYDRDINNLKDQLSRSSANNYDAHNMILDRDQTIAAQSKEIAILKDGWDERAAGLAKEIETARLVIEKLRADVRSTVERRLKSDEACGHPFDEDLGNLMSLVNVESRGADKGEGET